MCFSCLWWNYSIVLIVYYCAINCFMRVGAEETSCWTHQASVGIGAESTRLGHRTQFGVGSTESGQEGIDSQLHCWVAFPAHTFSSGVSWGFHCGRTVCHTGGRGIPGIFKNYHYFDEHYSSIFVNLPLWTSKTGISSLTYLIPLFL